VNWLDAAIFVVIIWFTFSAFQAGFVRESVTVAAAVLGVVLAGLYYKNLATDVLVFIDGKTLANLVAFGVIFGAAALAGQMLALVLKPAVHMFQLGVFDQLAGAVFGFAKAMVFVQIFLIVFITYPKWGLDKTIDNSFFGSLIVDKSSIIVKILPAEFSSAVDHFHVQF
jgi:uncharacterized membrane protein required for colicin V production